MRLILVTPRRTGLMSLALWLVVSSAATSLAGDTPEGKRNKGDKGESTRTVTFQGPRKRLAIMDMEVKVAVTSTMQPTGGGGMTQTTTVSIPPPTDFGTGLTEMLTTALTDTDRFVCLERRAIMDIQTEQSLMSTPMADQASAPAGGRLLGAQVLIRGAVTEYTYSASSTGGSAKFLKGVGVAASRSSASVGLDMRMYDAATGEVLESIRGEGSASATGVALDVQKTDWQMSTAGFRQTPLGHATRKAIEDAVAKICRRMETIPWEGRLAEVDESDPAHPQLYVNGGARLGLRAGDTLQVLRPGRPITDPETRTVIGRAKDVAVGGCRLVDVQDALSIAEAVEGQGFRVGDVVRLEAAATGER